MTTVTLVATGMAGDSPAGILGMTIEGVTFAVGVGVATTLCAVSGPGPGPSPGAGAGPGSWGDERGEL